MFRGLRTWWAQRKKRGYEKYAAKRGWIDEKELDRLREDFASHPTTKGRLRR